MVGIVLVSHSARLVAGVRELVEQAVQGAVPLAVAGGIDDPDNPIGTDAMKVLEAIQSVYSDDGVVVLMDLGSALLSAEMAVEFLPQEQQPQIYLCSAPFVEGAYAAVVQASTGASAQSVMAEAAGALAAKIEQLGGWLTIACRPARRGTAEPERKGASRKRRSRSPWSSATGWDFMRGRRHASLARPVALPPTYNW